jgi:hypothetical protein
MSQCFQSQGPTDYVSRLRRRKAPAFQSIGLCVIQAAYMRRQVQFFPLQISRLWVIYHGRTL